MNGIECDPNSRQGNPARCRYLTAWRQATLPTKSRREDFSDGRPGYFSGPSPSAQKDSELASEAENRAVPQWPSSSSRVFRSLFPN